MAGRVFIGTSGFHYVHWRGVFYPEEVPKERWLAYYQERFSTVEINRSFYRLPERSTVESWTGDVSEGFVFALKASQFITHRKKLKDPSRTLERFIQCAEAFGPRAGPLLYQLPPRWRCNPERLRAFLEALPEPWLHVLEFRDDDWYRPEVRALLEDRGAGFCIHDHPGQSCPRWVTAGFVYLRFHGSSGPYEGSYSTEALRETARRVEGWAAAGRDVYVYFNNDPSGHAVANAQELIELCGK